MSAWTFRFSVHLLPSALFSSRNLLRAHERYLNFTVMYQDYIFKFILSNQPRTMKVELIVEVKQGHQTVNTCVQRSFRL